MSNPANNELTVLDDDYHFLTKEEGVYLSRRNRMERSRELVRLGPKDKVMEAMRLFLSQNQGHDMTAETIESLLRYRSRDP